MGDQMISVISSDYCVPHSLILQINADKGFTYINGNKVLNVEHTRFNSHRARLLSDIHGNSIFTLYNKNMTLHERCLVFNGKTMDDDKLVFITKRSSMIQRSNMKLDVFLAKNTTNERKSDFKVQVSSCKGSCAIYAGDDYSRIIAQMWNNGCLFQVRVEPNVDYAFIVALLLIVSDMKDTTSASGSPLVGVVQAGIDIGTALSN